jgi:chromosome segregation ATPase
MSEKEQIYSTGEDNQQDDQVPFYRRANITFKDLAALKIELTTARQKLKELTDDYMERNRILLSYEAKLDTGRREAKELRQRITELENENATYRTYLQKLATVTITSSDSTNPPPEV